jgi:histone-lysine N-methyltransferase SETMAR
MDHPPYSPDLAPTVFWMFPRFKSVLKGKHFSVVEDITSSMKEILTDILVQDFKNYFEQWVKRWEHCKVLEGDYFETFYVANTCSS